MQNHPISMALMEYLGSNSIIKGRGFRCHDWLDKAEDKVILHIGAATEASRQNHRAAEAADLGYAALLAYSYEVGENEVRAKNEERLQRKIDQMTGSLAAIASVVQLSRDGQLTYKGRPGVTSRNSDIRIEVTDRGHEQRQSILEQMNKAGAS